MQIKDIQESKESFQKVQAQIHIQIEEVLQKALD